MKLPRLAIENHQFTLIAMLLLGLFGMSSFLRMPRSEDPQFTLPITGVVVVYPGANPTDLEKLVADPLEEAINELEDIKKFETTVKDGLVVMEIEFFSDTNPDDKEDEVNDKINSIRSRLPADILQIDVFQFSPANVNILQVALISPERSYNYLDKQIGRLKKQLERVVGIKKVETWAYPETEVRLSLDMEKMAQFGVSLQQVINVLQSGNANIPGGSIDIGSKRFNLETSGNYESLQDISSAIIAVSGEKLLYLRDIAEVGYHPANETHYGRQDGRRAIFLTAQQKKGTNIFNVMKEINAQIALFQKKMPDDVQLEVVFDQSDSVENRLGGFYANMMQGILLVGIIILLAFGMRASFVVMLTIPLSILIAIGLVDLNGYGIQQMSIVGLVIALGLLVDNATVVTDNVTRYMRKGYSNKEAAIQGTSQIAWPIVSSTITTVLAFVPMVALDSTTGSFIRSMPVTVIYTLLASLLISLTLTPLLTSRFLKADATRRFWLQNLLQRLSEGAYRDSLRWSLQRPLKVLLLTAVVFAASMALIPFVGVTLFPKAEKSQFLIYIDLPEGSSLDQTSRVAADVEAELDRIPDINSVTTNIGRSNPRIYYNMQVEYEKSNHALLVCGLTSRSESLRESVVDTLRARLGPYPGARIQVKEFEQGPPILAPVEIKIIGEELTRLDQLAAEVASIISGTPGSLDVYNPLQSKRTNLKIDINRAKASMLGVPLVEIDRTVRAAVAGLPVSLFKDAEGEEYSIVLRLPMERKPLLTDIARIYVSSLSGARIPLSHLADLRFIASAPEINHYNLERTVSITANVQRGFSVDEVTSTIISQLEEYPWPDGYRFYVGGEVETRQDAFGGMIAALVIAMVAILGVLVVQFRSYIQPLIVFSAIPVAIVGSVLALLLTGYTFSFTAFVGLTSLVGIVVNNSIILVDYINQLRAQGIAAAEAIQQAGETRLTPILLTTATTVGGLLPLTIGGGTLWAPMGWTIIGGLIVSTLLTLIVVPVLYRLQLRGAYEPAIETSGTHV